MTPSDQGKLDPSPRLGGRRQAAPQQLCNQILQFSILLGRTNLDLPNKLVGEVQGCLHETRIPEIWLSGKEKAETGPEGGVAHDGGVCGNRLLEHYIDQAPGSPARADHTGPAVTEDAVRFGSVRLKKRLPPDSGAIRAPPARPG